MCGLFAVDNRMPTACSGIIAHKSTRWVVSNLFFAHFKKCPLESDQQIEVRKRAFYEVATWHSFWPKLHVHRY